jgi:dihydroorotate dehydrogenase (NAD+) catalytic subunit
MITLPTSIGKVQLRNPLILASGFLGSTYSSLNRAYDAGLGAVTTKSIGIEPREGYPNPSVIYLPDTLSMVNAVGLANPGCVKFASELLHLNPNVDYIISIYGGSPEEFADVITCFQKNVASHPPLAFEMNLSCPHAKKLGSAVGSDPETVTKVVKAAKKVSDVPIWVKLTPNITSIVEIGESAVSAGADALVAINTLVAMMIDITVKKPVLGNKKGGLSGRAIKPVGVRAIYDLYDHFGSSVPLVGVGGIWQWEDIIEYILAGASAVQLGTIFTHTPSPEELLPQLFSGLSKYLRDESLTLPELRGIAHE